MLRLPSSRKLELRSERGQGTVEYVGLVLLMAVVLGGVLTAAGVAVPGASLARAIADKLVCAVRSGAECGGGGAEGDRLAAAYGGELGAELAAGLPEIGFEDGEFISMPVDFRRCRARSCADTSEAGEVRRSFEGERPTVFTRVIDCREGSRTEGADCGGEAAGHRYLQYWMYYPESNTERLGRVPNLDPPGPGKLKSGFHYDDWEGFQVRIDEDGGRSSRASSHNGYNGGRRGLRNALSDAGLSKYARWGGGSSYLHVARGSHAGAPVYELDDGYRLRPEYVRLVPLEPIVDELGDFGFAVTPPWRKKVWNDPESPDT